MIGKAVNASSPSMLGARKPDATGPSPRCGRAFRSGDRSTDAHRAQPRSILPEQAGAGLPGRPHFALGHARRLGLAEQVVDRALAVVGGDGLLEKVVTTCCQVGTVVYGMEFSSE